MTFFPEKISIFTPKISDDFFLVIDQVFQILRFFTVLKCRIRPFLHKKNHYFRKEFLDKTIFYSVSTFARIRQNYFSKYWGTNAWAVPPPQIFGGTVPPVPLGLRPWEKENLFVLRVCLHLHQRMHGTFDIIYGLSDDVPSEDRSCNKRLFVGKPRCTIRTQLSCNKNYNYA